MHTWTVKNWMQCSYYDSASVRKWPQKQSQSISFLKISLGEHALVLHILAYYIQTKASASECLRDFQFKFQPVHGDDRYFIPRYNTMKCQLKSTLGTLLCICRKMSVNFWYLTTKCQLLLIYVRYIACTRYTWNCQVFKCPIQDLQQVWLE